MMFDFFKCRCKENVCSFDKTQDKDLLLFSQYFKQSEESIKYGAVDAHDLVNSTRKNCPAKQLNEILKQLNDCKINS